MKATFNHASHVASKHLHGQCFTTRPKIHYTIELKHDLRLFNTLGTLCGLPAVFACLLMTSTDPVQVHVTGVEASTIAIHAYAIRVILQTYTAATAPPWMYAARGVGSANGCVAPLMSAMYLTRMGG